MIDFDIAAFEKEILTDIESFKKTLSVIPPVDVMTKEQLEPMDIEGKWPAIRRVEDAEYYIGLAKKSTFRNGDSLSNET